MILTPIAEISRRLADRAEEVCLMLLPAGQVYKGQWLAGDAYGSQGESLKVNLTGNHIGHWKDWARPEDHGDLLDLWRLAKRIDAPSAIKEAKAFLGIRDPELKRERKTYTRPSGNGDTPLDENDPAIKWLIEERKLRREIISGDLRPAAALANEVFVSALEAEGDRVADRPPLFQLQNHTAPMRNTITLRDQLSHAKNEAWRNQEALLAILAGEVEWTEWKEHQGSFSKQPADELRDRQCALSLPSAGCG